MFIYLITFLVMLAVFLIVEQALRQIQAYRVHQRVLAMVASNGTDEKQHLRIRKFQVYFFQIVSFLAQKQAAWIPIAWGERMEKQLAQLPQPAFRTPAEWFVIKQASLVAGGGFGVVLGLAGWLCLLLALGAFFIPDIWLWEKVTVRRRAILQELPEVLDLLAACLEAGLGFETSLQVFLDRGRGGPLHELFQDMMQGIRIGRSRRDAMHRLAALVDDTDFTTFVTALIQAERLGVSVAQTIKNQAQQLRAKRFQQIEKQALEAPVKLLLPLVVFIFPVVFLVLFGPIVLRFMQGF